MKITNKIVPLSLITSMVLSTNLLGATPPSSSDILRQVEPSKLQKEESTIPKIEMPVYKNPMKLDNKIKIGVKSFKITNNTAVSNEELGLLLKNYENKELTLNELNEITELITKYYRDKGYFVARAYLPEQALSKTDAIVEITIIEGHYGEIQIKNDSYVNKKTLLGFMNQSNTEVISTQNLERKMLLVDELGGVKIVNAQILTGKTLGTSDFIITTQEEPKYYGYVLADNYGSRYTGEYRANAVGYINSVSGKGDTLNISALTSTTGDLANGRVGYSLPIGSDGLNFETSFAFTKYAIGKEFKNLDITGNSTTFDMGLNYPIIKSRAHSLVSSLTYTNKIAKDKDNYQEDRKKDINSLKLSLNDTLKTTLLEKNGVLQSSISITSGNVNLNSYSKSIDTLNSDGNYSKVNATVSHIQSLIPNLSLLGSINAQMSLNKNLDGIEDLSAGGTNGVKAYTDSELTGDKGYIASLGLNYDLPVINGIKHSTSTFVDHAKVWNNTNDVSGVNPESRTLNDVGVGYNLDYKSFSLKSTYAHGFGADKTPTGDGNDTNLNRVFVQGMMKF